MRGHPIPRCLAATLLMLVGVQAAASQPGAALPTSTGAQAIPSGSSALPDPPPAASDENRMGDALAGDVLDAMRGGDDTNTTINTVDVDGRVDGNTASNIVTGTNSISDGSFANSAGISTVIQNSGANVLIQNGMVVNVQFADPGL